MDVIITDEPVNVDARLDALARRYKRAGGFGIEVLNLVGGRAENLLDQLPSPVRGRLEQMHRVHLPG